MPSAPQVFPTSIRTVMALVSHRFWLDLFGQMSDHELKVEIVPQVGFGHAYRQIGSVGLLPEEHFLRAIRTAVRLVAFLGHSLA